MDIGAKRSIKVVAIALITTVVLQIVYMAFLGGPKPLEEGAALTNADVIRYFDERGSEVRLVWTLEAVAFLSIALGSLIALVRGSGNALVWSALALAGVFNLVQIGIGLSMFELAANAGGDDTSLFYVFVMGAFFFYFLAKVFVGIAGVSLGMQLLAGPTIAMKALAGLTVLLGLGAVATNLVGMALGGPALFVAGAVGTLATLFVGVTAGMTAR